MLHVTQLRGKVTHPVPGEQLLLTPKEARLAGVVPLSWLQWDQM